MDLTALNDFLTSLKWAIAGGFGAVIVSRFHKDELAGRKDFAIFVLSGAAIAHFIGGAVVEWFDLGVNSAPAVGFLLGAFGGSIMQAIARAIKKADLWEFLRSRFGGRK